MKTILITGTTSGIGRACAEIFETDTALSITGKRERSCHRTLLKSIIRLEVLALAFDVRNQKEVEENLSELPAPFKDIDICSITPELAV